MSDVDDKQLFADRIDPVGEVTAANPGNADARHLFTYSDAERLKRRADLRLIPLFILSYLVKNIDSNIISYLKTMNTGTSRNILTQLDMTSNSYSYLSTVFTVSFIVFEIPMNLFIKKATPRLQFVRIISSWSLIVGCTAAVQNAAGLYVCRFLLGVAEAGLWSGIIYHITCWYRPDEVAVRLSLLTMLGQFSGILDALLAYGLTFVTHGLAGWRWAFIVCGLIGLVVSALLYCFLPDFPDSPPSRRQFLTPEEGAFMVARLPPGAASSHDLNFDWAAIKDELKSPLLYAFPMINLFSNTGTTGVSFWLPTITSSFGLTSTTQSQLLNIPPAVIFVISAIATGFFLDRTVRIPKPVALILSFVGLMGSFIGLVVAQSPGGRYACILIAYLFNAMSFVSIWPLRAQTIRGSTSSAFMFAFSNTVSNIPGVYTAQIFRSKYAPRYTIPFVVCIIFFGLALITSCLTWYLIYDVEKQTREVAHLRRKEGKESNTVATHDVVRTDLARPAVSK